MANKSKKIYAQKHFIDGANNRVSKGEEIKPDKYDRVTMDHYERYGMVGAEKPVVAPKVTKPAFPKQAGSVEGDGHLTDKKGSK
jgi:hypothetical protein